MNYTALTQTASGMIRKNGAFILIERDSGGVFDPVTGNTSGGVVDSFPGYALQMEYSLSMIDGTAIKHGDKKLLIASDTAPVPSDRIQFGGKPWYVIACNPMAPAGTAVYYSVQVRGAP